MDSIMMTRAAALAAASLVLAAGSPSAMAQCSPAWTSSNEGFNGVVNAMHSWDADEGGPLAPVLVAGGDFTQAGPGAAMHVAKWTGTTWGPIGSGLGGNFDSVTALGSLNGVLYAGGFFNIAGGGNIARLSGGNWIAVGGGALDGQVNAMVRYNNQMVVAGFFAKGGNTTLNGIGATNGTTWSTLGSGTTGSIYALAAQGSDLYAGGFMTSIGGVNVKHVAKWNGSSWQAMGTNILDQVNALAIYNNQLHAGGFPTFIPGSNGGIARWNGSTWVKLAATDLNNSVLSMQAYNGELIVGGRFDTANNATVNRVARWNGAAWSAMPPGPGVSSASGNPEVRAFTVHDGLLALGGNFSTAGNQAAKFWSRWGCVNSCYADCDESGSLTIDDFICFQTSFALGDSYADCDDSGSLSIDDFICFQTSFAIGC